MLLRLPTALACLAFLSAQSLAAPPTSIPKFLKGDDGIVLAPGFQSRAAIAPGGPGYLVVWMEERTVLLESPSVNDDYPPLNGNATDVYGARLDTNGNLLDTEPILIANWGRQQPIEVNLTDGNDRPEVAWNGENWLVVFRTQRPSWYFFEDARAVRVSPEGEVLDPEPGIPIWEYQQTPDYLEQVSVEAAGSTWYVVLNGYSHQYPTTPRMVWVVRVAADGTVLDDPPKPLTATSTQSSSYYKPISPRLTWDGQRFLFTYSPLFFYGDLFGQVLDKNLNPISPLYSLVKAGAGLTYYDVASDGNNIWFVVNRDGVPRAWRFRYQQGALTTLDGDPGLDLQVPNPGYANIPPDVAWNGTEWVVVHLTYVGTKQRLWAATVAHTGPVTSSNVITSGTYKDDRRPQIAVNGGNVQLVWTNWPVLGESNILGGRLDTSQLTISNPIDVTTSTPRQTRVALAANDSAGEHLAVYFSESGDPLGRIVAQRLDSHGNSIGPAVDVAASGGSYMLDVAWNGQVYLVVWTAASGRVMARRLNASGAFVDPAPVTLTTGLYPVVAPLGSAVGADFYVSWVSGTTQVKSRYGRRLDPNAMQFVGTTTQLGTNHALEGDAAAFGSGCIVVWERQKSHDNRDSWIHFAGIDATGNVAYTGVASTSLGDDPAVAVAGNEALVVWHNNVQFQDWRIDARRINVSGTLLGPQFAVNNAPEHQWDPSVAWDGANFVVAWTDFRSLSGVEQPRGDIYAARVSPSGTVLDPAGFQVTEGPLGELLVEVSAVDGTALMAFDMLGPAENPSVPRIATSWVGEVCQHDLGFGGPGTVVWEVCGEALVPGAEAWGHLQNAPPLVPAFLLAGLTQGSMPFAGGTLVPIPPTIVLPLFTDATGSIVLSIPGGPGPLQVYTQFVVPDSAQAFGYQISNAVAIGFP